MKTIERKKNVKLVQTQDGKRYLIGRDEGHFFRQEVGRVNTIEKSFYFLIPQNLRNTKKRCLRDGVKRQGDLFFAPFEEKEGTERSNYCYETLNEGSGKIGGTNHEAESWKYIREIGDVAFVGRKGKMKSHSYQIEYYIVRKEISHPQHSSVYLDEWHRVYYVQGSSLMSPAD